MTLQKTTNERLSTSTPLEFIEGKSPSEIADKLGIFLSTFELYFWKENSKFWPVRSWDTFWIIKNLDNLGTTTLIRERGKKREEVILESTDIFSEIYKPSKLLPSLEIKRQENGRYQVGSYEVTTTNMDTLRNEMQRIVIILTQTCMTRWELKQLSDLCKIETTGEKGKKGAPVYELKQNPAADAWYGNLLPGEILEK